MPEPGSSTADLADRDRSNRALLLVVAGLATLNSFGSFISEVAEPVAVAIWAAVVVQPLLIGMWTALGSGSMLTRLPLAAPSLMLLFVAPGYIPAAYNSTHRYEFVTLVLAGFAVFGISIAVFTLFRYITRLRILPVTRPNVDRSNVAFRLSYLFALMTMYAITIALTSQLKFDTSAQLNFLGPDFFVAIALFGGTVLTVILLPTMAVPLAILHGHINRGPAIVAISLWAIATTAVCIYFAVGHVPLTTIVGEVFLAELTATVLGALAALTLRWGGLRLVRVSQQAEVAVPAGANR